MESEIFLLKNLAANSSGCKYYTWGTYSALWSEAS